VSAKVKLSGALPGDEEINGLDAIAEKLVETPEKLRLCLMWLDVREIRDVTDTGERVPVLRVRRVEVAGDADDAPQELRDMVLRLAEARTGKTPLPIDRVQAVTDGPVE
jgi:hypothetical protein